MADLSVHCPDCDKRLRVPAGKKAVRCPDCEITVRVHDIDAEDEDPDVRRLMSRVKLVERVEDEDRPRASKRRPRDEEDDQDDRPRRRRRRDEDEVEEDDRPRRRQPQGDGPWLLALGATAGCFLLAFGLPFLLFGRGGLAAGQDGPQAKLIGLGIGFVAALIIAPMGIVGVKQRNAAGKWGIEVKGNMGVVLGMVQSVLGGLIAGFTLYGLIFTLLNGR